MTPGDGSQSTSLNRITSLSSTEHYDFSIDVPYSLFEADAVFHNVSIEVVIRRYIAARLREVSDAT